MKTKHTPGSWLNYDNPLHSREGVNDSNGNRICVFRLSPKSELFENAESNTKLIAAAPELLEALNTSQQIIRALLASKRVVNLDEALAYNDSLIKKATE